MSYIRGFKFIQSFPRKSEARHNEQGKNKSKVWWFGCDGHFAEIRGQRFLS
jgi:hypothetical protein